MSQEQKSKMSCGDCRYRWGCLWGSTSELNDGTFQWDDEYCQDWREI